MNRRESLKLIALASLAASFPACRPSDVEKAASRVAAAQTQPLADQEPIILDDHQFATIRVLVDYIIPADERSGSASEAGVPAFIDFLLSDVDGMEPQVKDGLAWLDAHCTETYGGPYISLDESSQRSMLDQIAFPDNADARISDGVAFFTLLRDLTASGFFSSKMGVEDLGYTGNTAHAEWLGCPPEAHQHLGIS